VFVFGFIVRQAPPVCGVVGLLINPIVYAVLKVLMPVLAFLDRMAVSFGCVLAIMYVITRLKPLPQPVTLPKKATIALETSGIAKAGGIAVVAVTLLLYIVFW